jgi:hypothetical protein
MMSARLLIILVFMCRLVATVARAQQNAPAAASKQNVPATAPAESRQVKLLHLNYADAGTIAQELSIMFPSNDVRIVADKRTNALIVLAPAAQEAAVADLVAELDAPAPPAGARQMRDKNVETEIIPLRGADPELVAKALEAMLGNRTNGEGSAVAVVRSSAAVQRVLQAVSQPSEAQNASQAQNTSQRQNALPQPSSEQDRKLKALVEQLRSKTEGGAVKIIHLTHQQASAIANALAAARPNHGSKPTVVMVLPSKPSNGETPATASKPAGTLR